MDFSALHSSMQTSTAITSARPAPESIVLCDARMKQETVQAPSAVGGSKKRAMPDREVAKKEVRVDGVVAAPSLKAALDLPWNDAQLQRTHPLFFGQQGAECCPVYLSVF